MRPVSAAEAQVPLGVRVRLGHAAAQHVADAVGARILHLKGYALAESLRWPGRVGTDVDVLVHPGDLKTYLAGLAAAGWACQTGFEWGSAFGHSSTLLHPDWGYLDVHRLFPGLGPDAARSFEALWAARTTSDLGGRPCTVPDLDGQALVLLLHAGRSEGSVKAEQDVARAWGAASAERRASIEALVGRLGAEVGFAAAVGGLERYSDRPEYRLWQVASQGGTRLEEWRARVAAAPTLRAKAAVVARAPLVNVEHLAATLGRRPTRAEIAREFVERPLRGVREEMRRRRARVRGAGS